MAGLRQRANEGTAWDELDTFELETGIEQGRPIPEMAEYLGRTEQEVDDRIEELRAVRGGSLSLIWGRAP